MYVKALKLHVSVVYWKPAKKEEEMKNNIHLFCLESGFFLPRPDSSGTHTLYIKNWRQLTTILHGRYDDHHRDHHDHYEDLRVSLWHHFLAWNMNASSPTLNVVFIHNHYQGCAKCCILY